jgi:geranylgeranyl reductase family protein
MLKPAEERRMARPRSDYDLVVVGAGFAGLIAAATAAARGLRVAILEAKPRAGARVHTTGLLVKEAAEELDFPVALTRKIHGVRLYAPNLRSVDLFVPGYYFLATDTAALLDWLAERARAAGARLITNCHVAAGRIRSGIAELEPTGVTARFVIGADGPRSQVARMFGLGVNRYHLAGVEAEFPAIPDAPELLHCFLDSRLAPGYLGWAVPGVGVTQVGLALRERRKPDLDALIAKITPVLSLPKSEPLGLRGGLIPCGGLVQPFANSHVLLVGDAAGLVSPLTGGGIHRALHFGRKAALSVCDYLCDGGTHPGVAMQRAYPSLFAKRLLRMAMNVEPPAVLYNAVLNTPAFLALARMIYFNRRTVSVERSFSGAAQGSRRKVIGASL